MEFKIGEMVRYYPTIGYNEYVVTRIRSEYWRLGHGAKVVMVEGRAGGVLASQVRPAQPGDAIEGGEVKP